LNQAASAKSGLYNIVAPVGVTLVLAVMRYLRLKIMIYDFFQETIVRLGVDVIQQFLSNARAVAN
jgi:hypothetical protein